MARENLNFAASLLWPGTSIAHTFQDAFYLIWRGNKFNFGVMFPKLFSVFGLSIVFKLYFKIPVFGPQERHHLLQAVLAV